MIIVFDIPVEHDKLRDELRNMLKDYGGTFLQYSVYTIDLESDRLEELLSKIGKLLLKGGGRVDVFKPCGKCYKKIRIIDTTSL